VLARVAAGWDPWIWGFNQVCWAITDSSLRHTSKRHVFFSSMLLNRPGNCTLHRLSLHRKLFVSDHCGGKTYDNITTCRLFFFLLLTWIILWYLMPCHENCTIHISRRFMETQSIPESRINSEFPHIRTLPL
jgi:hypothetical protein